MFSAIGNLLGNTIKIVSDVVSVPVTLINVAVVKPVSQVTGAVKDVLDDLID